MYRSPLSDTSVANRADRRPEDQQTLCFSLNSFERGADIIILRTEEGALKCAFLDFLLDEAMPNFHHSIES